MKSSIIRATLVAMSLLEISCACRMDLSPDAEEIIYIAKNGSMIDIFNFDKNHFSTESMSYLKKRDFQYGEFGGQMKDCSNNEFYCLGGGINVAVPKNISGQRNWEFLGRICEAETPLHHSEKTVIVCRSFQWATKFTYSPQQGIVSYGELVASNLDRELFSKIGIFSQHTAN